MKVLLSAPTNTFTGYGNDGVSLARALLRWGVDVYLSPSSVHPPVPRDVAALLTKDLPDHVDLHISHRCPQELARPDTAGLRTDATVALAWSMHEWDSLDNIDELSPNNCEHAFSVRENLAAGLARFDAVLAYDPVSVAALSPYHPRVALLQGGVDAVAVVERNWRAGLLDDPIGDPFRFLMLGALSTRKNPWAAISAYRALRERGELANSQLVLKTTLPGLHPAMEQWCPGLRIIDGLMRESEIDALRASSHVLLAPSWGEGKNIPAAQFAMSGGAVALPRHGGHAMWARPEFVYDVPFTVAQWSPGVRGAQVAPEDLAEVMLAAYTHRDVLREKARVGAQVLPGMLSWRSVLERLAARLPEIVPGNRGEEVATLLRAARRPEPSETQVLARERGALDPVPT